MTLTRTEFLRRMAKGRAKAAAARARGGAGGTTRPRSRRGSTGRSTGTTGTSSTPPGRKLVCPQDGTLLGYFLASKVVVKCPKCRHTYREVL